MLARRDHDNKKSYATVIELFLNTSRMWKTVRSSKGVIITRGVSHTSLVETASDPLNPAVPLICEGKVYQYTL